VGYFIGHAGDKRYSIQHMEQDLDGTVISGRSYTATQAAHANWTSDSVNIDARRRRVTFTYVMNIGTRNVTVEGITTIQLQRSAPHRSADALAGYAHDLNDLQRIHIQEIKVSDQLLAWDQALQEAIRRFP